jgi:endonuclease/exonuclease/phosphatase family metal-dependent hydrolase
MVSILTLNLRFGLAKDGPNDWKKRKKSLRDLLGQYAADFSGFQEANDFQIDYLEDALTGYDCIGRRTPAPAFWQSNVIFFRKPWQCVHKDYFFLSPTPDIPSRFRDSLWPRQCTVGMFRRGSDELICINTHLDFSPTVQAASARIILDRIRPLPQKVPVIVFGDFNAGPDSPCHRILTGEAPDRPAGSRVFQDVFTQPYPATYHGFTGKTDGDHIDWILYSGALVPTSCAAIQEAFDGRYPSDHYPLFATFARP